MQYDDGDWKELQSRADSASNAVFLMFSGALTLSITVLISLKQSNINIITHAQDATASWYMLLGLIGLFLLLKTLLIAQSFARGFIIPEKYNPTLKYPNWIV